MLVGEVIRRQRVSLEEVTEFYVVNLLAEYATAEKLFTTAEDGKRETQPLALLYHQALTQERTERIRTLRRLGDLSLYTAGFFHPALEDTLVGAQYYVDMGKTAYASVADLSGTTSFAGIYQELHQKFGTLVEILSEIAARGRCASGPQGQMQVFENWSRTGNERLGEVLVESGLLPKNLMPN